MINSLEQLAPGARPELELGFAGMRAKEIENLLVEGAKSGKFKFEPGPYRRLELIALANGYVAQGLLSLAKPAPVDPRKKEMDDLKAQVEALTKALTEKSVSPAPAAPADPPEPDHSAQQLPARGPGRPKKV